MSSDIMICKRLNPIVLVSQYLKFFFSRGIRNHIWFGFRFVSFNFLPMMFFQTAQVFSRYPSLFYYALFTEMPARISPAMLTL